MPCPPGFVRTGLGRNATGSFKFFFRRVAPLIQSTPQKGARTAITVATSPELSGVSGQYFADSAPAEPGGLAGNRELAVRLWTLSEKLAA
jgi:hypothetical protein